MEYDITKNHNELKGQPSSKYFGQWETDRIIESYFKQTSDGICVEVGAANGIKGSNTLYFEQQGWRALCIEPNPKQYESIEKHRKHYLFSAVADKPGVLDLTVFDVGEEHIMSSLTSLKPDQRLVDAHAHIINDSYKVKVNVATLTQLLELVNYPTNIDFISIDTEGTELDVLKGFDFDKYNVKLFVIENNYEDSDIDIFMNTKGYIKTQRYKINDFYIKNETN